MKQKIYIFGFITTLIVFTGAIFKIQHWPGAGILLTVGLSILVLLFLPIALINNYKADRLKQNLSLYIATYITCFVVFTGMLFKIQHWPFAGIALTIALPFPYIVFLPVFLSVTSKNKNFSIYNVVFVLSLLALNSVFSVLLALNVSKATVNDSYNLSQDYNKLEKAILQIPGNAQQSAVNQKIDNVIKIVNEYEDLILKEEGITREQWVSNPDNLWRPEVRGIAANTLAVTYEPPIPIGGQLSDGLLALMSELNNTRGYEEFAKAAPVIFDYNSKTENVLDWGQRIFAYNNMSWTLIYLDGLKANLYLIKGAEI